MAIKEKDFVKINFTGKTVDNDAIFDMTLEDVAEEAGIKDEQKVYGPLPIIVGGGHLLAGLDKEIIGMKAGDKKTVTLEPADAYGERDSKLIQVVPMGDFKKQNIKPYVGMALTIENQTARVVNISGGRVRLDFNHVLAGKTVEYDLEVVEIIKSDKDKIKSMVKLHYPNPRLDETKTEVSIRKGVAKITLDDTAKFDNNPYMDITFARFRIARDIWENIETITKVEFIDAFEKQIEEPEEESEDLPEKIPEVLDE